MTKQVQKDKDFKVYGEHYKMFEHSEELVDTALSIKQLLDWHGWEFTAYEVERKDGGTEKIVVHYQSSMQRLVDAVIRNLEK